MNDKMKQKNLSKVTGEKVTGNQLVSNKDEVSKFLQKVAKATRPNKTADEARLIFSLDATASRAPTWDTACQLQAQMFSETTDLGGLAIQLCYYRGFKGFSASNWHSDTHALLNEMSGVRCLGGHTQILRVLRHGMTENRKKQVKALVFIGDAMEENPDDLCHVAGQLGVMNVPVFIFQEGNHPVVRQTFQQISRLSGGAYAPFDLNSAHQLKTLLTAVAVFAAGGRQALKQLERKHGRAVQLLTQQLKG